MKEQVARYVAQHPHFLVARSEREGAEDRGASVFDYVLRARAEPGQLNAFAMASTAQNAPGDSRCEVCQGDAPHPARYTCPCGCRYCSVACFRQHRTEGCSATK